MKEEGTDYRDYGEEEKKTIAMALATAGAVKAVLDTPILTKEGAVTEESLTAYKKVEAFLPKVEDNGFPLPGLRPLLRKGPVRERTEALS